MLDLLNASIPYRTVFSLLIVLGFLLIVEIFIFALLLMRSRSKSQERELVGITLDTAVVKREFTVGEEFDCSGLIVQANYSPEPTSQNIADYVVLTEEELDEVKSRGELDGCYVVKPDMNEAGKKNITVIYLDKTSVYSIAINEAVDDKLTERVAEPEPSSESVAVFAEPVTVEETSQTVFFDVEPDDNNVHYNKSFKARLIQSNDEVKQWYAKLKNELLSYKKIKARTSWKKETFRRGRVVVAKMCFRGKTMCLYLPLNASDFTSSKYRVEDVSKVRSNDDTPLMYRLKSSRRIKYATELIAMSMEKLGIVRVERNAEDYYVPYEEIKTLLKKGLVKREPKSNEQMTFLNNSLTSTSVQDNVKNTRK